ncbi:MAG: hypothetical protein WCC60_05390, partial [Ilumatobacteraceae bacterium]
AIRGLLEQRLITLDDASGRVVMAPSIRTFATDRLIPADVPPTVERHGAWFAAVAERFAGQADTLPASLLAPDEADVFAALDTAMHSLDPAVAYRIIIGLGDHWVHLERQDVVATIGNWLSSRSPSDGEQQWAAAVARMSLALAHRPESPIHALAEEALAVAEIVHDEVSPGYLARAAAALQTTVETVRTDMAATT